MHGDVTGIAPVSRAQGEIVGGREPDLDRKRDPELGARRALEHPTHRLGGGLACDPVLHLGEPDPPLAGKDLEAAVDLGRAADPRGGEAGEARRPRRGPPRRDREQLSDPVLEHDLPGVRRRSRPRPGRLVGATAFAAERRGRVREDVELEVVVDPVELVEPAQHLVERLGAVDPVDRERPDRAQGDGVDHAERAEADACRPQVAKVATGGELDRVTVGAHELHRLDLRGEVSKPGSGAVGRGRDRAGEALAVDVAEVLERQPELVEAAVERTQDDPALNLDQARRPIGGEDPVEPVEAHHQPIGERDVAERVPRCGGTDPPPLGGRAGDELAELRQARGSLERRRPAALIAGPVAPFARHGPDDIRVERTR
jgi:hypothetical protein